MIGRYPVIVSFQAVFSAAPVSARPGPSRCAIVTPCFHHWHHAQAYEAIDRNCAAHFAFIDHPFGTAVPSDRKRPDRCGVVGDCVTKGF